MINGHVIKKKRTELGLTQEQVVESVKKISGGLAQSSYVKIEKGGVEHSKFLPYICQVLGLKVSEVDSRITSSLEDEAQDLLSRISNLPDSEQLQIAQAILSAFQAKTPK